MIRTRQLALGLTLAAFSTACSPDSKTSAADSLAGATTNAMTPATSMAGDTTQGTSVATTQVKVTPIEHASAVLDWASTPIYVDPVGGAAAYTAQAKPRFILVTDIHADHMDAPTLAALAAGGVPIIAPKAVHDSLPAALQAQVTVLANGETHTMDGFTIEAIPMYNTTADRLKFHAQGRGNGYVISKDGVRVYFSGDTEDIPEMRALRNIDLAFVCMNLPYTMTVEQAASAVAEFTPKVVYPYHYRGTNGMSDVTKFKSLVNAQAPAVKVEQFDWYPAGK